jgi:alanyl-tRNA synthetase
LATERLYHADSHRLEFEARVLETFEQRDSRRAVVLDRTAFHPTGGGQPHDLGSLSGAEGEWRVDDVVHDEANDRVLHVVSRDLSSVGEAAKWPEPGSLVSGKVDALRRRDHLQQHTGQHVLSQAFVRAAKIETKSFHMGERTSTIDVEPRVTDEVTAAALAIANDVVFSDRPTKVHVVTPAELEKFPVRRQTFHGARIRLVEIEDFDVSTCGGTHAQRTGEIGLIAIKSVERQKGLHRVEFVCGARALREYRQDRAVVEDVARTLSTADADVPAQVRKLVEQGAAQRKRSQQLFALAAEVHADRLLAAATPLRSARVVVAQLEDVTFEEAQLVAKTLVARGQVVALLGVADSSAPKILFARSNEPDLAPIAMGPLVKSVAEKFGGRGGGSPTSAQASIRSAAELDEALTLARSSLPA